MQLDECKFGGSVDGDEQVELAFLDASLGEVDVEVADPVILELEFLGLLTADIRQPPYAMALQAAVQR